MKKKTKILLFILLITSMILLMVAPGCYENKRSPFIITKIKRVEYNTGLGYTTVVRYYHVKAESINKAGRIRFNTKKLYRVGDTLKL